MDEEIERVTLGKVTRRLIPFMFLLYVFNYLDRLNVSMAGLTFKHDLRLSDPAFGFGMGIFFVGYFIFEVPSNLIMNRVGARRWIGQIVVLWGIIASSMMFVHTRHEFYALRFSLGLAEAGFFPGMVLYLTYWFPASSRARAAAKFMIAGTVSSIIGSPLGGLLLKMNGVHGLRGWQWLFLIEGLPSILLGVVTMFYLTDRPENARWLLPEEREWLARRMSDEETHRKLRHDFTPIQALCNQKVLRISLMFLLMQIVGYGVGLWTPLLLKARTGGLWSNQKIGLMMALPGLLTVGISLASAAHSDRTRERRKHMVVGMSVSAIATCFVALAPNGELTIAAMTLGGVGSAISNAPFWAVATTFLSGAAAAGGIGFINGTGNLGGLIGPTLMGGLHEHTHSFQAGLLWLSGVMSVAAWMASRIPHDASDEHPDTLEAALPADIVIEVATVSFDGGVEAGVAAEAGAEEAEDTAELPTAPMVQLPG